METKDISPKEERERRFFEWFSRNNPHIRNYKFPPKIEGEQGSPYDASCVSGDNRTRIIFEVKCRIGKTNEWLLKPGYGPFAEKMKLTRLFEAKERILREHGRNVLVMYITFTKTGYLIYRLKSPDQYQYEEWLLPENNEPNSPKKFKDIVKLRNPEEQGLFTEHTMTEDEWHYINSAE